MRPEHEAWIVEFIRTHSWVGGKCAPASAAMVATFHDLRLAAGFVHTAVGRHQHWWCVSTLDGGIVDPTVSQFESVGGIFEYQEVNLDDPEEMARVPTGRCMDCGEDTYQGAQFCGDACERAFRASLGVSLF